MKTHDYRRDRQYLGDLRRTAREFFTLSVVEQQFSHKEFAQRSGISYTCLMNFKHGRTKLPRFSTVYGMAKALGLELTFKTKSKRLAYRASNRQAS